MEEKRFTAYFICISIQQKGEKRFLLMQRGEDPFLNSLSGVLFKDNFPLNAKDKRLVSCMGLNMAFLSWYFWTLIFFFLHYLMIIFPLSFPMMCKNGASQHQSPMMQGQHISDSIRFPCTTMVEVPDAICFRGFHQHYVLYKGTSRQIKGHKKLN